MRSPVSSEDSKLTSTASFSLSSLTSTFASEPTSFMRSLAAFSMILSFGYILTRFVRSKNMLLDGRILAVTISGMIFSLIMFVFFAIKLGWLDSYLLTTVEAVTAISGINLPNGMGLPNIFNGIQADSFPVQLLKFLFSKSMLFYWSLLLLLIFFSIEITRFILRITTYRDSYVFLIICFGLFTYASIVGRSGHYFVIVPFVIVTWSYFLSILFLSSRKILQLLLEKLHSIVHFLLLQ